MLNSIEDDSIYIAAQSRSGINFYGDAESLELADRYDTSDYRGKLCSDYRDSTIEMVAFPFVIVGYGLGRYFGLDREGLDKAIVDIERMPIHVGNEPSELVPDFRLETYEDRRIYFPTGNLLEAFGVQLVETPQTITH